MIPGGNTNFTATPDVGTFLPPYNEAYNPLSQIIWGGIAVNDPSEGRKYQYWETFYDSGDIKVKPVTGSVEFTYSAPNATIVSGAFDQNMDTVVAWLDTNNDATIYFYELSGHTTLTVSDVTSIRLVVDDINDYYSAESDIMFCYTKNDTLYYRLQRDNYATEYAIGNAYGKQLKRVGMTNKNRVQFELLV